MSRMRDWRIKRGLTQRKMQQLTGIDQSDYSKLETGKRCCTIKELVLIALALDTSTDYLLERTNCEIPFARSKNVEFWLKTDE